MLNNLVNLATLPREIANITKGGAPSYRRLYNLVVDAKLPAQQIDGRWYVGRDQLPAIIEQLGLGKK